MRASPSPAKLLLERRVLPEERGAFERWTHGLLESAKRGGTLEGSSVLTVGAESFILLRFISDADLEAWESSAPVREMLSAWSGSAVHPEARVVRTGLETWFTVPGSPLMTAPPKWKMALVTWLALIPQVLLLGFVVPQNLPYPLAPAVSTAIPVAVLTWLAMPGLSKLLSAWLYPTAMPSPELSVSRAVTRHDGAAS